MDIVAAHGNLVFEIGSYKPFSAPALCLLSLVV
jgi:hypothetical protein